MNVPPDPITRTEPSPQKLKLRREGRAKRKALDPEFRQCASEAITRRVLHHLDMAPEHDPIETIFLFASFGDEVHTHELIKALLARRKRVALPYIIHSIHRLELRLIDAFPEGHRKTDYGILEPEPLAHPEVIEELDEVDLILVPGVVFDRHGNRIGYGGGYYDRLLADAHHAPAMGLAFEAQLIERFEPDPWDRPVDLIATEEQMHKIH